MGNQNSVSANQESAGSISSTLTQFSVVSDIPIDQARQLCQDLLAQSESGELSWSFYFNLLQKQMDRNKKRNNDLIRKFVHPATLNYVVREKRKSTSESLSSLTNLQKENSVSSYTKADYFTDDSASESSEPRAFEEAKSTKSKETLGGDRQEFASDESSEIVHPAFIGNVWESFKTAEERKVLKRSEKEERCKRAVDIARKFRTDAVEQMEKRIGVQRSQREKKMHDMTTKFDREVAELQSQLMKDSIGASPDLLVMMQVSIFIYLCLNYSA